MGLLEAVSSARCIIVIKKLYYCLINTLYFASRLKFRLVMFKCLCAFTNSDYLVLRPLSEIDVMWQWEGKGVMSMGYGDLEENFR